MNIRMNLQVVMRMDICVGKYVNMDTHTHLEMSDVCSHVYLPICIHASVPLYIHVHIA